MKVTTFLIIPVALSISQSAFSKEACMQDVHWYGHTKTCYENVNSSSSKEFIKGCLGGEFFQMTDETAKSSHELIEQCPPAELGKCKGANPIFDTYYYVNVSAEHLESSCKASGGQWVKPKT